MNQRALGKTGRTVSEIGYGGWGIGRSWWGTTDDAQSLESLAEAWKQGVTFYDTAYVYGDGHSEELMGRALENKDAFIATKIPPKNQQWPPTAETPLNDAFPADWIVSCTERSLKKLRRETLDLQQLHVWTDAWMKNDDWKNTVARLKKEGKIRAFGVSINDHQPHSALELAASGLADTVQVIFNIFDQSPLEKLFPLCQKNKVGVIVRVPFDEGSLTGTFSKDTKFEKGDFRAQYFGGNRLNETLDRVEKLKPLLGQGAGTIAELAIKFILSHDAVSVVIPGMRKINHVRANVAMAGRLEPDLLKAASAHAWNRNYYGWWED